MEELGVRVVVTDRRTLGAVGIAHVPGAVQPDDLIAFSGGHPWRVLALLPTAPGATLRVLADQVALAITARQRFDIPRGAPRNRALSRRR